MQKAELQQQIIAQIKAFETIIIHRHEKADPDALGSQVGLAEIIRASFPAKKVYVVGANTEGLDWLATMDQVTDETYRQALVIVTDTANTPRVDDQRFDQGQELIKIDHHPNDDAYGDIQLVDDQASSTSELIFDLQAASAELQLPATAAQLLYAGIVGDTGRFMFANTSTHTFNVAGELVKADFDPTMINRNLDTLTLEQARLSAYVLEHMTVLPSGAAYVTLTTETLNALNVSVAQAHAVVSLPGKIAAVQVWSVFVQQAPASYRVHLRSKGPIVNQLAKAHDGGGHPLASGARAYSEAEIKAIIAGVDQLAQNNK
ncbi:DHH family phosphoesterase [Loigolactobacillus coryniformis]|uniref:Bifunctional oligoribonuclease/PAP phosphatase NrnA n=1 Tax=Loigolactobacillus coryniformis TaxID=1610 RepID=A0A5B8THQ9_9LACO|nr:bifunctional oligoribonuclease/PAP phosphatase NrnA [Loigolactobacillus coryniformis]QEA53408.1 bifunctional oligoribonuclease/PAP phosphatase NrnA [Loigolactobacillus coryniformis]